MISIQLTILLFFLLLLLLAALFIICIAIFTPWTHREKSYFFKRRYPYISTGFSNVPFSGLFAEDKTSYRGFRRTEPGVYLSVIIPAMNEELRLPSMMDECIEYLEERAGKSSQFTYEVIVVDDGSTDGTADVALRYAEKQHPVFVLKLRENIGKGGAVRAGVLCARGRFILFVDADGASHFPDFAKLEREIRTLCNGNEEGVGRSVQGDEQSLDWTHPALVVGSRAHLTEEAIAKRSMLRTVLMLAFHAMVWVFTVRTIRDTQCGFKLFSRAAAAKLFSQHRIERWAFDVELIYLAERLNFSLAEVPVKWTEIDGSKLTPLLAGLQMGRDILVLWFRYTFGLWTIETAL